MRHDPSPLPSHLLNAKNVPHFNMSKPDLLEGLPSRTDAEARAAEDAAVVHDVSYRRPEDLIQPYFGMMRVWAL